MTRTTHTYASSIKHGDIVWIKSHGRRVENVEYRLASTGRRFAVIVFQDGTKEMMGEYREVLVVLTAEEVG